MSIRLWLFFFFRFGAIEIFISGSTHSSNHKNQRHQSLYFMHRNGTINFVILWLHIICPFNSMFGHTWTTVECKTHRLTTICNCSVVFVFQWLWKRGKEQDRTEKNAISSGCKKKFVILNEFKIVYFACGVGKAKRSFIRFTVVQTRLNHPTGNIVSEEANEHAKSHRRCSFCFLPN